MHGHGSGRGIITGSGDTAIDANVTGLSASLSNNIIIAEGDGNIGIGTSTFGNNAATVLAIANGTAPTTSITEGVQLYAEDVASSSELKVRDEEGNVTTLSPHNFSLLEKSEPMAWSFYSENSNVEQRINVDMLKTVRLIEKMSGEQLVYIVSEFWKDRFEKGEPKDVWVYSNCDSVALYNDLDKEIKFGSRIKNAGPRGDTRFQWNGIELQNNLLYPEAWYNGKVVVTDTLQLENFGQ